METSTRLAASATAAFTASGEYMYLENLPTTRELISLLLVYQCPFALEEKLSPENESSPYHQIVRKTHGRVTADNT
jgi:hypothetical protein